MTASDHSNLNSEKHSKSVIFIQAAKLLEYLIKIILEAIRDGSWLKVLMRRTKKEKSQTLDMQLYGDVEILKMLSGQLPKGKRKLWLIFTGGGQAGIISAGVLRGMFGTREISFNNIAGVIGVSAGVCNEVGLFSSRDYGRLTAMIYSHVNSIKNMFSKLPDSRKARFKYLWKTVIRGSKEHPLVNTKVVYDEFMGDREVDPELIQKFSGQALALVMNKQGNPKYLNLKDKKEDLREKMRRAIIIAGVDTVAYGENPDREIELDGSFTVDTIPFEKAIAEGATDIIIFGNNQFGSESMMGASMGELKLFAMGAAARNRFGYSDGIIKSVMNYGEYIRQANKKILKIIKGDLNEEEKKKYAGINILVIAPGNKVIDNIEVRKEILVRGFDEAFAFGQSLKHLVLNKHSA